MYLSTIVGSPSSFWRDIRASPVFNVLITSAVLKFGFFLNESEAALIAFSRLYLFVHYPSDILVGIILGVACSLLTIKVMDKSKNERLLTN